MSFPCHVCGGQVPIRSYVDEATCPSCFSVYRYEPAPAPAVVARIIGIRSQDLVAMRWYSVYPEKEPAYCTPLPKKLHVVFGAENVGTEDGNLWGRLTNSAGKVLIEGRLQWCPVGQFVYWESDLDMPFKRLDLVVKVGHDGVTDQTYSFSIETTAKIPYDYIWEWQGRTNKATFKWTYKDGMFVGGTKPPSDAELIERARTAYYGVIVGEFVSEFAKQGVDVTFVDVLPSAWVERSAERVTTRRTRWWVFKDHYQDITVHVAGKVFFNSSKELMGSPIEPATLAALIIIAKYAIAAILTALTVIVIAKLFFDWITVTSEVTKTTKIILPEETHIEKDLTLPDGTVIAACQTLPAGTVLEWETTESTEAPAPIGRDIVVGGILIGGLIVTGLILTRHSSRQIKKLTVAH